MHYIDIYHTYIYHYIYVVYTDSYDELSAVLPQTFCGRSTFLTSGAVSSVHELRQQHLSVLLDQLEYDLVSSSNVHNCKSHC